MITELTFEGDIHLPIADQDQIAASIKQRTYSGDLDEALGRVKLGWQDHGYFKIQVRGDTRVLTSSRVRQTVALTVHVEEGRQYRLSEITFKNNKVVGTEVLCSLFAITDGDIFGREKLSEGLESVRKVYGGLGYINFTTVPDTRIDEGSQMIALEIDVDEGKQFVVGSVNVLGFDEHAAQKVLKDILLKRGDIYNQRLVERFLVRNASLMPDDDSPDPRFLSQLDERAGTVALTFDFRTCSAQ